MRDFFLIFVMNIKHHLIMIRNIFFLCVVAAALSFSSSAKTVVYNVKPVNGDATKAIQTAI